MSDSSKPEWSSTDDDVDRDPDIAHEFGEDSGLAHDDAEQVGETDRIAEEKGAYEAAPTGDHSDEGHALGGSEGTAEGQ